MFLFTAIFHVQTSMIIILVMSLLNFVLILTCPRSPSWLLSKGREQDAFDVLKKIRGNENIAKEDFERLKENKKKQMISLERAEGGNSKRTILFNSLKKRSFLRPFLVLLSLFLFSIN